MGVAAATALAVLPAHGLEEIRPRRPAPEATIDPGGPSPAPAGVGASTTISVTVSAVARPAPAELAAHTQGELETFSYEEAEGGWIDQEPAWVQRNIVAADVPIFGEVRCHSLMIEPLRGALQELVDRGLDTLVDPENYGGCWAPRHIDRQVTAPLSQHAWGLAIDLNVAGNELGRPPEMDLRIVEVFEEHGFRWGGRWSRPDGMHFELAIGPAPAAPAAAETATAHHGPTVTVSPAVVTRAP